MATDQPATTEKVKRVWTTYHPDRFTTTYDEKAEQFDAWLAQERAEAFRQGQENPGVDNPYEP